MSLQINEDAGKALYEAAKSAQGIEKTRKIREVAKIIREDLLTNDEIFNCDASLQNQLDCIPSNLLYMLQMIVSGAPSEEGSDKQIDNIVLCIAQLIRYNTVKNKRDKNAIIVRHRADNEPPFPTMLGMIVHATTRSKTMVDYLNWHGLTPGYQRVKCIRRSIAKQICNSYNELGYVCPPSLQESLFTLFTIDNIDHILSSSTAKHSFHGTAISVQQNSNSPIKNVPFLLNNKANTTDRATLPASYTDVQPVIPSKVELPADSEAPDLNLEAIVTSEDIIEWFKHLMKDVPIDQRKSLLFFFRLRICQLCTTSLQYN